MVGRGEEGGCQPDSDVCKADAVLQSSAFFDELRWLPTDFKLLDSCTIRFCCLFQSLDAEQITFHVFVYSVIDHIYDIPFGHLRDRLSQVPFFGGINFGLAALIALTLGLD